MLPAGCHHRLHLHLRHGQARAEHSLNKRAAHSVEGGGAAGEQLSGLCLSRLVHLWVALALVLVRRLEVVVLEVGLKVHTLLQLLQLLRRASALLEVRLGCKARLLGVCVCVCVCM